MDLIPSAGVGEVRFGMTPKEVGAIFGAETTWEDWMGGNLNDSLYYPGIIFYFDRHDTYGPLADGKLVQIEAKSSFRGRLFETALSSLSRSDVLLHLRTLDVVPREYPNGSIEAPSMHMHWWFRSDSSLELLRFDYGKPVDPQSRRPPLLERIRQRLGLTHVWPNNAMQATCETHAPDGRRWASEDLVETIIHPYSSKETT